MSAIHIELVFRDSKRKQEDELSELALEERALPEERDILADEPLKDDKPDKPQCTSECASEEK